MKKIYTIKHGYFQPEREDKIRYHFSKDECCKLCTGKCPIEGLSAADLYFSAEMLESRKRPKEDSPDYCLGIARLLLTSAFQRPVDIYYNMAEGYWGCLDGRHRICVAQKLNTKARGIKTSVLINLMLG